MKLVAFILAACAAVAVADERHEKKNGQDSIRELVNHIEAIIQRRAPLTTVTTDHSNGLRMEAQGILVGNGKKYNLFRPGQDD